MDAVRLHELRSSLVADVLDELGLEGVIPDLFPIYKEALAVGRAMPVLVRSAKNSPLGLREGLMNAVDDSPKSSILVISSDTRTCSVWGGLTSRYAKLSGVAGVIVCGAVRDTFEITRLRLPVFSYTVTPISGYNRVEVVSSGTPIKCGSVVVQKDDLVVADREGVAIVQAAMIQDVLERASRHQAKERQHIHEMRRKAKHHRSR